MGGSSEIEGGCRCLVSHGGFVKSFPVPEQKMNGVQQRTSGLLAGCITLLTCRILSEYDWRMIQKRSGACFISSDEARAVGKNILLLDLTGNEVCNDPSGPLTPIDGAGGSSQEPLGFLQADVGNGSGHGSWNLKGEIAGLDAFCNPLFHLVSLVTSFSR
jgi:hypothetical protein